MAEKKVKLVGRDTLADEVRPKRGPGNFKGRVTKAAKDAGLPVNTQGVSMKDQEDTLNKAGIQETHPGLQAENPVEPKPVRGRQMMANYVLPHYYPVDKDERMVGLEFSFLVTKDHKDEDIIPHIVEQAWRFLVNTGGKSFTFNAGDIEAQTVDIRLVPDDDVELHLSGCEIRKAKLTVIEETGTGAAQDQIRFSFQVVADTMRNVCTFADHQYGKIVWIEMADSEGKLKFDK